MSKKKTKKKHFDPKRQDFHHYLWQKRMYNSGWAKRLREHPYCGDYIPQMTLHKQIHDEIPFIPTPEDKYCKRAYEAINSWLEAKYISMDDSPEEKLATLIKCFKVNCPKTSEALEKQKEIVTDFYKGGH